MTWLIEYDDGGGWTTFTGTYVDQVYERLSNTKYFKFKVGNSAANRTIVQGNPDVRVSWDGNVLYTGTLLKYKYSTGIITCYAYPNAYNLMIKRTVTSTHNASAANNILTTICDAAGVNASFDASGWVSMPTVSVRFDRAKAYHAARYLTKAVNGVFDIDTDTFYISKTKGSHKGTFPTITDGEREVDKLKERNRILYIGVDSNGSEIVGSYGAGSDVEVFRTSKASDVTTLNNLAEQKYDELNTETLFSELDVDLDNGYDLNTGDTIDITDSTYDYSASALKIVKTVKNIDGVTVSLEKSKVEMKDLIEFTRDLEDIGIYVGSTSQLALWLQPWSLDWDIAATGHNTASWSATTIEFSGGETSKTIDAGTITVGDNNSKYLYYTIDDTSLNETTSRSTATAQGNILLAYCYATSNANDDLSIVTDIEEDRNKALYSNIEFGAVKPYMQIQAIQPYNVDVDIDHVVGDEDTAVTTSSGTVTFSDGTTHSFDSSTVSSLVPNTEYFLYFDVTDSDIHKSTNYADVVGENVGQIATLRVPSTAAADESQQEIAIIPFRGKSLSINADFMNANVIRSIHLSGESIHGKDIATGEGVGESAAGIRMVGSGSLIDGTLDVGLHGFSAGGMENQTFFLDHTTGKINVNGTGSFIVNAWDASSSSWYDLGYLEGSTQVYDGDTYDMIRMRNTVGVSSPNSKGAVSIDVHGDDVIFYEGSDIVFSTNFESLIPSDDKGVRIGNGSKDFQIHIPNYSSDFTGVAPTADEQYQIRVLRTAGNDAEIYFSMQNSGGTWEWQTLATGSAVAALSELTDVNITGPAALDLLQYNGTNWVDRSYSEAGVVATTDTDASGYSFVLDEDDMASDSNTKLATQQSIKAYVDGQSVAALDDIGDVTITTVGDNDILAYDSVSSDWINQTAAEAGLQEELTFGISDNNAVEIDSASVADNDYAKFTANGLEGRSYSEVKTDLSLKDSDINSKIDSHLSGGLGIDYSSGTIDFNASDITIDNTPGSSIYLVYIDNTFNTKRALTGNFNLSDFNGDLSLGDLDDVTETSVTHNEVLAYVTGSGWKNQTASEANLQTELTFGIGNTNALAVDGAANNNEYARFTANGLEGRTYAQVKTDLSLSDSDIDNKIEGYLSGGAGIDFSVTSSGVIALNFAELPISSSLAGTDYIAYYNTSGTNMRRMLVKDIDLSLLDNTTSAFVSGDDVVAIDGDTMTGNLVMSDARSVALGTDSDALLQYDNASNRVYIKLFDRGGLTYSSPLYITDESGGPYDMLKVVPFDPGTTAGYTIVYNIDTAGTGTEAFRSMANGIGIGGTTETITENGVNMEFDATNDFVFNGDIQSGGSTYDIGSVTAFDQVYADTFHGDIYWGDMKFTDMVCPECGENFKIGDEVTWVIIGEGEHKVSGHYFSSIPKHRHCNPWKKLKYKITNWISEHKWV